MLDPTVRSALAALISASEDYLMGRILAYARERGYSRYTSTLKEAWRLSVQGLSASITGALGKEHLQMELSPDDSFVGDPVCDFAVAEAISHRVRGVTLPMFLGLFKYYRQVYLDLVLEHNGVSTADKMAMLRFLDRAFDRMEIAYCKEWSTHSEVALLEELQSKNREVTNEKNAYLTVFESLSDPVILIDGDRRIVNLNLAAARLLDPLAQPGQIYYGMVQPPSKSARGPVAGTLPRRGPGLPLKEAFPWLEPHLDDGYLEEGMELNTQVAGSIQHFHLKVSNMLDVSGKFSATVLLLQDVGPLKEAQELRRNVEVRMLELRRQEGLASMAGGIAHDFNNMLATIVGNVALMDEQLAADSPVNEQVRQIQRTAASASELASQMLAYSGKGHFRLGALDLNDEVEKTSRLIQSTVTARYPVELRLERNLPLAQAEGRQLRQLLMELCLNAQEAYRGKEGRIVVKTGLTDLAQADLDAMRIGTERPPGTYLSLAVGDEGEGMSPEVLGRAFDPFFTTRMVGRGLGLAAVYGVVRGHGGALQVKTSPGGGSTVTVYLQVAPAPAPSDPLGAEARGATSEARGHRMLFVDDEASVAYVFSRLLALKGFTVVVAKDGEEALAKARTQGPFDLVLTDWTMPGLAGKPFLEALALQLPGVQVVVMSGFAEEALDALGGEVPFIHKPFSLGDLLSFLERLGFSQKG